MRSFVDGPFMWVPNQLISQIPVMKYVENIAKLGKFSEPEEFYFARLFSYVWKLIILIMMILLAEHKFVPNFAVH
jgi:hypothetical protein